MRVEAIAEFSVRKDRYEWRTNPVVKLLTEGKVGDKFRAYFDTDYLRKRGQRGIGDYLRKQGIQVKTQGWSKIAEFERLP